MECRGHCAPAGFSWTGRSWTSARRRPATSSRRPEGVRDPLFQHPNPIPQLGRELEVLALDGPPELRLQVEQAAARIIIAQDAALPGELVPLPHVLARAVEAPQQVAQVRIEGLVATIAAEPAGVAEVSQRASAGRAPQAVAGRGNERARGAAFHYRAEEIAQRTLEDRATRFHALLLGALLAQVERDFGVMLDLGQVDDGVAFLTVVAQHQGIASTELTVVSRPSSSNSIRSARPASWRLCVTTTTAVSYSRASRKKISCSRSAFAWSRLPDGSSASTTLGSCTNARATAQRCCSPPESSAGRGLRRPASPTSDSTSSARERALRGVAPPISRGIMTFSNAENSRSK